LIGSSFKIKYCNENNKVTEYHKQHCVILSLLLTH